ncbi:putative girdin isoform X1 [Sesbania bispinosa]|nr:putative girdin isoform X1 [Sesbania bispinosa]
MGRRGRPCVVVDDCVEDSGIEPLVLPTLGLTPREFRALEVGLSASLGRPVGEEKVVGFGDVVRRYSGLLSSYDQRTKEYVFSLEELSDEEISVVEALQALKKKHGVLGSHCILDGGNRSLKDRLGDMAGNNALALVEKRARREASKEAAAAAASSNPQSSKPGEEEPNKGRPEKRARMENPKSQSDPDKGVGSSTSVLSSPQPSSGGLTSPRISWATPDPEEDAALKLLSQQGQRIFKGTTTSEMKDFLGQVGTWCLRGGMMVEFFHSTIDEVAALPQIKKDFEAVSQKLKDDEVKMTEALGKVKSLTDDNLSLTEKNDKLLEETEKLKLDLVTKKSETIQAVLEKQKTTVEDFEAAKEEWKLKAADYEKEIRRAEDL